MIKNQFDELGRKQGLWEFYDIVGRISHKGYLVDGKKQGVWESYYQGEEDKVCIRDEYVNNLRHGPSYFYNLDGSLITKGNYVEGKPWGLWEWYWEGELLESKEVFGDLEDTEDSFEGEEYELFFYKKPKRT